jgi:hypothetical protein
MRTRKKKLTPSQEAAKARLANQVLVSGPLTSRERHLRSKYGITCYTYAKLEAHSDNTCWICGQPPKTRKLAVDHSHKTGLIRGLLCYNCNRALRWLRDNPVIARNAATYLESEMAEFIINYKYDPLGKDTDTDDQQ